MVASFAGLRNDGDLCPSALKIEDGVGRISLGEQCLFGQDLDDSST